MQLPKRESEAVGFKHFHRLAVLPVRRPQLRLRSVGTFITIKVPETSVLLYENRILVNRLPKPASIMLSKFSSTVQVVPHIAVVVTVGTLINFRLQSLRLGNFPVLILKLGLIFLLPLLMLLQRCCCCHRAVGLPLVRQGCRIFILRCCCVLRGFVTLSVTDVIGSSVPPSVCS